MKDWNNINEVTSAFTALGGQFVLKSEKIKEKLSGIKAFIFDWDGVFNKGFKSKSAPTLFAEPDAAGLNLLRLSFFISRGAIPPCAIITGEDNPGAVYFSQRDFFNGVYMKVLRKPAAMAHFCSRHQLTPAQVAFIFDDINDIALAKECGLRFMVKKSANPVFRSMAVKNKWCDYLTGNEQDNYPIREICELIMALNGTYEQSLLSRIAIDDTYNKYLKAKRDIIPSVLIADENGFSEIKRAENEQII
jgi:3-deoxy-D-manno-octulosonate 8-phosphate phosphatase (KDO 8-P phosphatase)